MSDLADLFRELQEAKAFEAEAKAERMRIEEKVLELVDNPPERGSTTIQFGAVGRVTVKYSLSYKADLNAIRILDVAEEALPLKLVPAKYELDERAYEALRDTHPDVFTKVAQHVAVKPKKPALTLKV